MAALLQALLDGSSPVIGAVFFSILYYMAFTDTFRQSPVYCYELSRSRLSFSFSFCYLILSRSLIAFTLLDLADTDHHDAITWPHLLLHIGYEDR